MKTKSGFTFIELLIFIVIMGVISSLLAILFQTMLRNSAAINNQTNASQTAAQCMDWYTGERFINGFTNPNLVCGSSTASFCTAPAGYSVIATVTCSTYYGDTISYKTITVTAEGTTANTKSGKAILSTIIANY
ncbi:MAG: prepilin-type N-terminal cleavage/methylation domain-containing protein [Gammaproteobacteria bacterium]|nr:prepilin-type N-terminal cleavage/methylation domain-containing protein [Gammaproteobacteria bacterium]